MTSRPSLRVGQGFDVHRFAVGRPLFLGGVRFDHDRGLEGHSDADVVLHAICDAILGALAEGDIGHHFPDSDARWKGSPSRVFVEACRDLARMRGYGVSNVDITILAERPKIAPHAAEMRRCIADMLRVEEERVSIKATTTERLGFTGREEGIAALAVVLLEAV